METMFLGCEKLTSLDLTNFDTSKVESMRGMFFGCTGLTKILVNKEKWYEAPNTTNMFTNCGIESVTLV